MTENKDLLIQGLLICRSRCEKFDLGKTDTPEGCSLSLALCEAWYRKWLFYAILTICRKYVIMKKGRDIGDAMTENAVKRARMPNVSEYQLVEDVRERVGLIAAASLQAVLFDEAKHFAALSGVEIDLIRQLAEVHKVTLPK